MPAVAPHVGSLPVPDVGLILLVGGHSGGPSGGHSGGHSGGPSGPSGGHSGPNVSQPVPDLGLVSRCRQCPMTFSSW